MPILLEIVTPERLAYSDEVDAVEPQEEVDAEEAQRQPAEAPHHRPIHRVADDEDGALPRVSSFGFHLHNNNWIALV